MGVITVNLDITVETWYRSLRSGQRSEIINRILRNHIDDVKSSGTTIQESDVHTMTNVIYGRIAMSHGKNLIKPMDDSIEQARNAAHQIIDYLMAGEDE